MYDWFLKKNSKQLLDRALTSSQFELYFFHIFLTDQIDVLVQLPKNNVSELLFHPANFMNGDLDDLTDDKDMEKEHFRYVLLFMITHPTR